MTLRPISIRDACAFVDEVHRHLSAPQGAKFAIGISGGASLLGVVITGRPVARLEDDGVTAEIVRCAVKVRASSARVDRHASPACSMLYGAARRAAIAMGYQHVITFTRADERGTSLRAAGFTCVGISGGGEWSRPSRARRDAEQPIEKFRWEAITQRGLPARESA